MSANTRYVITRPATILIAEDDAASRDFMSRTLQKEGYAVIETADGVSALDAVSTSDVLLLDVMMPPPDGWEVLRTVRRTWPHKPVILVTGLADSANVVRGLDDGAYAYVAKPVAVHVLLAQVRRALGARPPSSNPVTAIRLLPRQRAVVVHGRTTRLSRLEYGLLSTLARQPGRVWSREALLRHVWKRSTGVETRVVDAVISLLRRKLGDSAASPRFVETVHGIGYAFSPPSDRDGHLSLAPIRSDHAVD